METILPKGLIVEPIDVGSDYLGGTSHSLEAKYGAEVLNPSGDWTPYTPSTEDQSTNTGDTYSCVSHGTNNAIEMLARLRFQNSLNLSDRFLAKTSGTLPGQGNSPKKVADQLRHGWSVNEPEWPDVDTVAEFYADIPQQLKTVAVARGAEFAFGYQYVANVPSQIKTALKYSPVCIAVTAWREENGVYVRVPGISENHWTTIIKVLPNGNYLCFDSFFPFQKEVHPDACKSVAMSYYLNRNVEVESAWKRFIKGILAWLKTTPEVPVTPPVSPVEPPIVPPMPPNTDPVPTSEEKLITALIHVESGGYDNAIGDKHLVNKAYGCLQIRLPVCLDVNRVYGTKLKPEQMLGNRALSIDTARKYWNIYLSKAAPPEHKARVWNGGPTAWEPGTKQYKATNDYWNKVRALL